MDSKRIKRFTYSRINQTCLLISFYSFELLIICIQVKRVLPEWLAKPTIVSVDLKHLEVTIDSIPELDAVLVKKLKNKGYSHFFPGN